MTTEILKLGIDPRDVQTGQRVASRSMDQIRRDSKETSRAVDETESAFGRFKKQLLSLRGLVATAGIGLIGREILGTASSFEQLRVQLETVTGSMTRAKERFNEILTFATKTPFSVQGLTESFVNLRGVGIMPTMDQFAALSDLAAARSRDITEAVQATVSAMFGEAESLKQFGIIMRQAGERALISFNGLTREVNRDAKSILKAITDIANVNFAGASEAQSQTFAGAISNLGDAFDQLSDKLLNGTGSLAIMTNTIRQVTELTMLLGDNLETVGTVAGVVASIFAGRLISALATSVWHSLTTAVSGALSGFVAVSKVAPILATRLALVEGSALAVRRAMSFLGGPIGIGIAAVSTGLLTYTTNAELAANASRTFEQSMGGVNDIIDRQTLKLKELDEIQKRVLERDLITRSKKLQEESATVFSRLRRDFIRTVDDNTGVNRTPSNFGGISIQTSEQRNARQALLPLAEEFGVSGSVVKMRQEIEKLAPSMQAAEQVANSMSDNMSSLVQAATDYQVSWRAIQDQIAAINGDVEAQARILGGIGQVTEAQSQSFEGFAGFWGIMASLTPDVLNDMIAQRDVADAVRKNFSDQLTEQQALNAITKNRLSGDDKIADQQERELRNLKIRRSIEEKFPEISDERRAALVAQKILGEELIEQLEEELRLRDENNTAIDYARQRSEDLIFQTLSNRDFGGNLVSVFRNAIFRGMSAGIANVFDIGGLEKGIEKSFDNALKSVSKSLNDILGPELTSVFGDAIKGAGVGVGVASIIGGSKKASAAAGAIGQTVGGDLGAFIASTVTAVVTGVFGGKDKAAGTVTVGDNGIIDVSRIRVKNGGDEATARSLGDSVIAILGRISDSVGANLIGGSLVGEIGQVGKKFFFDPTADASRSDLGEPKNDLDTQIFDTAGEAIFAALNSAIERGAVSGLSQKSLDLLKKLNQSNVDQVFEKVGIIENAASDIELQLLKITDPFRAALTELANQQRQEINTFRELGLETTQLIELHLQQRQKIEDDFQKQSLRSWDNFLFDLQFGGLSFRGTGDRIQGFDSQFREFEKRIAAGEQIDFAEFNSIARGFINVARDRFASSEQFFDILNRVEQATKTVRRTEEDRFQAAINSIPDPSEMIAEQTRVTDAIGQQQTDLLTDIRDTLKDIRETTRSGGAPSRLVGETVQSF